MILNSMITKMLNSPLQIGKNKEALSVLSKVHDINNPKSPPYQVRLQTQYLFPDKGNRDPARKKTEMSFYDCINI